ncbi:CARDB domain-containing protein, partial [Pyxidicoccus caerfyrddinensis]|uniref:CARDB domain-containing protein n=1 Tax=Pyxidicoccus caerfyrddinensis TaxID=2709663 RepID=UPI0023DDFC88
MRRNFGRTVAGALALASVAVGCSSGDPSTDSLKGAKQGLGGPDFVVTALSGPTSTTPGSFFNATVTVCNRGDTGGGTEVALVLSDDSNLSIATDFWGGNEYLGYLPPGVCDTRTVSVSPAPSEGAWYLGALADPYDIEFESDESNNSRLSGPMGVGYGPDFLVTAVEGPTSVQSGQSLAARVTVCNQGTSPGNPQVELYLSADEFIQPSGGPGPQEDMLVGGAPSDTLFPGRCATVPIQGQAYTPPPGTDGAYHLGAVVDPQHVQDELIEDNNTSSGYRIGVGSAPDFVITSVTGPTSVQDGQPLTAQVTVCNQGTNSGDSQVELYLSEDGYIQPNTGPGPLEDSFVGNAPTGWLMQGQCATVPIQGQAYTPPPGFQGAYHLGAVVDPSNNRQELIEDNNSSSGYRIGVGNRPDFVITSV